ncbi:hypothetical protein N7471_013380 [Penicillium samsonianum]|uniref:uncharacterized protein n=1 Tax=Penicillium samsonianum TaxID=1882272 RepID=UPI002548B13B|nr:uncharacterized protein N7471_013380 [Penicillium samsonianum]KAJ6118760.1 hypothetical protein N7471_013380 [Penicillium samsonianum]
MRSLRYIPLGAFFVRPAFGGTLQVINNNGQCMIWSKDNSGCTGYSKPFGLLNGDDCSKGLSAIVNGARDTFSLLNVDICGSENGPPAAWVRVEKTGVLSIFNQQGDTSTCILDNGFTVGSSCSPKKEGSALSSTSTSASATACALVSDPV